MPREPNAYVDWEKLSLNGIKLNPGCRDCVFSSKDGWCIYYLITGQRRKAKAGKDGCRRKWTTPLLTGHPNLLLSHRTIREPRRGAHRPAMDEAKAKELYDKGAKDVQIAAALNCSKATVLRWRQRTRLPSHFRPDAQRKDRGIHGAL